MSVTHKLTETLTVGNNSYSFSQTATTDGEYVYDGSLAANQTNALIACVIDVSQMKTLYIYSDVALVIKTNSTSSPAATLTLAAGSVIGWFDGSGAANPLGATDVTALYFTNTTAASRIIFRAGVDLTV